MKTCALILSIVMTLASAPAWALDDVATRPDRRHEIDLRIEALEAEREEISTKGPKVATIFGITSLLSGVGALASLARPCREAFDECAPRVGAGVTGITLFGVGGISTIVGGLLWNKRAKRRRAIEAEREALMHEREALAEALSRIELSTPFRDGARFVTLGFTF